MAQRMCFLLLVLSVSAVAADELSEGPGQLTCPPNQDSNSSYWFALPIPSGCNESSTIQCSYYLGVRRNPVNASFADFHLSATTHGYVAVGFSRDKWMGEDDVIGCKRDPQTGTISVVSAWNPAPFHTPNERDPSQRGVCQYHANYSDGQFSCRFSRYIAPVNPGYNYDLNNSYFLFLAISDKGGSPHFLKHEETPFISDISVNVLFDNGTAVYLPHGGSVRAHAVVMLAACPLLLGVSVLFIFPYIKSLSVSNYRPRKDSCQIHFHRIFYGFAALTVMFIGTFIAFIDTRFTIVACTADMVHIVIGGLMMLMIGVMLFLDSFLICYNIQLTGIFLTWCLMVLFIDFFMPFSLLFFQDGCGLNSPNFIMYLLFFRFGLKAVLLLVVLALFVIITYYRRQPEFISYWKDLIPRKKIVFILFGIFAIIILVDFILVLTIGLLFCVYF